MAVYGCVGALVVAVVAVTVAVRDNRRPSASQAASQAQASPSSPDWAGSPCYLGNSCFDLCSKGEKNSDRDIPVMSFMKERNNWERT